MKFIKRKNMQEGEELLYTPRLHWLYIVRPIIVMLPFFILFFVLWKIFDPMDPGNPYNLSITAELVKYFFPVVIAVVLLFVVWSILQYICTEYGVTNKRLIIKKGVLRISTSEISTDRIESIYCDQGILGRIFHYGTLYVSGIGGRMPVFFMVAKPYGLRRIIVDIIEKNKTITVVHGELPKPKPAIKEPEPVIEEPVYRYGTFVRVMGDGQKN